MNAIDSLSCQICAASTRRHPAAVDACRGHGWVRPKGDGRLESPGRASPIPATDRRAASAVLLRCRVHGTRLPAAWETCRPARTAPMGSDAMRTRFRASFVWGAQRHNVCLNCLSRVSDEESEGAGGCMVGGVRPWGTRIAPDAAVVGTRFQVAPRRRVKSAANCKMARWRAVHHQSAMDSTRVALVAHGAQRGQ